MSANTFNGTGTLAQLKLKIVSQSPVPVTCNITFERITPYVPPDTFLLDRSGNDISFEPENATFTYIPPPPHDISLENLVPSTPGVNLSEQIPIKSVVGRGCNATLYVTVDNGGNSLEHAIQVFVYWSNGTQVNQTVASAVIPMLLANTSTTLSVDWNTAGLAFGNYSLSAFAGPVPGETDTQDNSYVSTVQVHVGVPSDVTSTQSGVPEGIVDIRDITYIIITQSTPDSQTWKPNADINNDGIVDVKDITIATANFHQHE
jgi:hypothetical protein